MLIHPWDAALDPAEWQAWLAVHRPVRDARGQQPRSGPGTAGGAHPLHARRRRAAAPSGPAEPGLAAPGGGRRGAAGGGRRLRLRPDVLAGQGRRARRGRRADQLLQPPCSSCAAPRSSTTPRARPTSSPPSSPTSNPKAATPRSPSTQRRTGGCCPASAASGSTVLRVDAKFKYDDHNPVEHRERVIDNLEQRGHGLDSGAAAQQRRRLAAIGDWRNRRNQT